jgi:hypothetical protein
VYLLRVCLQQRAAQAVCLKAQMRGSYAECADSFASRKRPVTTPHLVTPEQSRAKSDVEMTLMECAKLKARCLGTGCVCKKETGEKKLHTLGSKCLDKQIRRRKTVTGARILLNGY